MVVFLYYDPFTDTNEINIYKTFTPTNLLNLHVSKLGRCSADRSLTPDCFTTAAAIWRRYQLVTHTLTNKCSARSTLQQPYLLSVPMS